MTDLTFLSISFYSMRENPPVVNVENETVPASAKPPNYSDLFSSSGSSLASTPPSYASKTPSVEAETPPETAETSPQKVVKKQRKTKKQIIEEAAAKAAAAKKAEYNKEDK